MSLSRRACLRTLTGAAAGTAGLARPRDAGIRGAGADAGAAAQAAGLTGLRAAQHASCARDARGACALPCRRRPHPPHLPRTQRGRGRARRCDSHHRDAARPAPRHGPSQRADHGESHWRGRPSVCRSPCGRSAATRRGSSCSPSRRGIGSRSPVTKVAGRRAGTRQSRRRARRQSAQDARPVSARTGDIRTAGEIRRPSLRPHVGNVRRAGPPRSHSHFRPGKRFFCQSTVSTSGTRNCTRIRTGPFTARTTRQTPS